MSCIVIKKILGYELCVLEREGTLYYNDKIVLIRKDNFTEIYNLELQRHETGDIISRDITRNAIYQYINEHADDFTRNG